MFVNTVLKCRDKNSIENPLAPPKSIAKFIHSFNILTMGENKVLNGWVYGCKMMKGN